jgi:hypothetical protein
MKTIAFFTLLMLTALASASAQKTLTIQYFQYPGSTQTYVTGVSNTGEVLGYYLDSNSNSHGFSMAKGEFTAIDDPDGTSTTPTGVNSSETIVGYYFSSGLNSWLAFSYSNGTFSTIGPDAGCINTYAFGINDLGEMAGECETASLLEGWIYTGGQYQILSVPGSDWSYASDINVHGLTTMIWNKTGSNRVQSSIYDGTTFRNIDEPNKFNTYAWAINAAGSVALSWTSGDSGYGALLIGKTYTNIQPTKCGSTQLTGINDKGVAVGMCGVGSFVYGMYVNY